MVSLYPNRHVLFEIRTIMLHVYFYISGLILGIVIFFIVRHVHTHFHKKTPIISQLDDEELDEIENLVNMRMDILNETPFDEISIDEIDELEMLTNIKKKLENL